MLTPHWSPVRQAHPTVRRRWHLFIEWILPWWDARAERRRDVKTEGIRQRSIAMRIKAERIIDDYKRAEERRR
jgi:hypothetical protein